MEVKYLMSLKSELDDLLKRYETIKDQIADAKAMKKQAKARIAEINIELEKLTKGKDVTDVIIKLEKEIEVRKQKVNDKIIELENVVESNKSGEGEDIPTIDDILEGDNFEI